jgi:hypothetical protein
MISGGSIRHKSGAAYFSSVLKPGNGEALGFTEAGAGLGGHVVGGDGCTSEESAINFLETLSVGGTDGSCLVGVGVDLDGAGSTASSRLGATTGGGALTGSGGEGSTVG